MSRIKNDDRCHGRLYVFQETVGRVRQNTELEQPGTEKLGGPIGRAHHQQEPIGRGGRVRHGTGGHHRRPTAVPVGQLAGAGARRLSHRPRRAAHRLQPVARLRQQSQLATIPRLPDEVSVALIP